MKTIFRKQAAEIAYEFWQTPRESFGLVAEHVLAPALFHLAVMAFLMGINVSVAVIFLISVVVR